MHPERFERPTPRFVVWCSIQLSYGRTRGAAMSAGPDGGGSYRLGWANASVAVGKRRAQTSGGGRQGGGEPDTNDGSGRGGMYL